MRDTGIVTTNGMQTRSMAEECANLLACLKTVQ